MLEIKIDAKDPDIVESIVRTYDDGAAFLIQTETDGKKAGTLLFSREAIPHLISALKTVYGHDSDCATHNEPAMPNGPCDCPASR